MSSNRVVSCRDNGKLLCLVFHFEFGGRVVVRYNLCSTQREQTTLIAPHTRQGESNPLT